MKITYIVACLCTLILLSSCTKTDPEANIYGVWKGDRFAWDLYSDHTGVVSDNNNYRHNLKWILLKDGRVKLESGLGTFAVRVQSNKFTLPTGEEFSKSSPQP